MDAERAVIRLMECQVAQRFVGSTMEVIVTGVHPAGAFVRADRPLVEGLMPIRTLSDAVGEYFDLDEESLTFLAPRSGKRLAVGEVTLYSEGDAEPVAHVTSTYSIPPQRG